MLQRLQLSPRRLVGAATQWHVTSQQQARRNALVASTALTQRRTEQRDVDDFLTDLAAARTRGTTAPTVPQQVSHTA